MKETMNTALITIFMRNKRRGRGRKMFMRKNWRTGGKEKRTFMNRMTRKKRKKRIKSR